MDESRTLSRASALFICIKCHMGDRQEIFFFLFGVFGKLKDRNNNYTFIICSILNAY